MDILERWRKNMEELGEAMAKVAEWNAKAADIILRMGVEAAASASPDPAAQAVHEAYAQPEKPLPEPVDLGPITFCDNREALAQTSANEIAERPCRIRVNAGAHVGRRGTVMAAVRGKKLRVNIDETGRTDDVFARDVTLLDGSPPLPAYVPKAKAK